MSCIIVWELEASKRLDMDVVSGAASRFACASVATPPKDRMYKGRALYAITVHKALWRKPS